MRPWLIFLLALGCTGDEKEDEKVELCNGVDDDEDGEIDEGFDDIDGDGLANCVDESCEVALPAAGTVEITTTCEDGGLDLWEVEEKWIYSDSLEGVRVAPVVGQLTDDDGDGDIDESDTPDVAFTTMSHQLVLLSGDTGEPIFELEGFYEHASLIIADVDADGSPDLVAMSEDYEIVALDGAGDEKWRSEELGYSDSHFLNGSVGDLEGDGVPEILYGVTAVSGADGSLVLELDLPTSVYWYTYDGEYYYFEYYYHATIADLDRDGQQELLVAENVYDVSGDDLWSAESDGYDLWYFPMVIDADGDEEGEVLSVSVFGATLYDADGTLLGVVTDALYGAGISCAADFDGDGEVELGFTDIYGVYVHELDGTPLWAATVEVDIIRWAGCSAYDFDADGAYELVYGGQYGLSVYDGAEGLVLWTDEEHAGKNIMEYPVVADADGDGVAEIVAASSFADDLAQGNNGITVYEQSSNLWSRTDSSWPTHDYRVVNVLGDGSVPAEPDGWSEYNVSRAKPNTGAAAFTDLAVAYVDYCVTDCPAGNATIGFQVWNQGAEDMPAGVPITLYAVDGDDLFAVQTLNLDAIPAGASLEGGAFEVAVSYFGPDGFIIRLDDDGQGNTTMGDCERSNNIAKYTTPLCE